MVDTWWQTETGGIMITPAARAPPPLKPGSATLPFFGVQPALVDADGRELRGRRRRQSGHRQDSWPGQMRTVYGDHERFVDTYFSAYPDRYFTGDGARRDEDGYYWITGRVDDVLNVSGHRMGTAEVESALVAHPKVAEAGRRRLPARHQGPGNLRVRDADAPATSRTTSWSRNWKQWVRKEIGPIAKPDLLQWAPALPKTRSGKIMRRILRKVAEDDFGNLGDTSTLADPDVVDDLIENRKNRKT
ncbi:MAG: AMP-binding protein [Woeseiaceae bacterium]|nr:AMP-binding protein [Woeseiaceae bacterium]